MDCERRLLHGQKNGLASAKARPNTLWMYCPVQPWILQLNWARDPPPVVLGIGQAPSYRSSAGSRCTRKQCSTTASRRQLFSSVRRLLAEPIRRPTSSKRRHLASLDPKPPPARLTEERTWLLLLSS